MEGNPHLHRYKLSFYDSEIEYNYLQNYQTVFLSSNRICLVIGILFYAVFGILDFFQVSGNTTLFHIIRFGITIPATFLLLLLSFQKKIIPKNIILFSFAFILYGVSILIINSLASQGLVIYYSFGIIILLIFGQNFLKITFLNSVVSTGLIVISYGLILIFSNSYSKKEAIMLSFFIIVSYILSSYSSYYFELTDRKNFWIQDQLKKKNNEFKDLQFLLEQKVIERTQLLKSTIEELEIAKANAEENNTIKSNFLATISHEIRTPLTSILGFSQLIANSKADPQKTERYIGTIEKSTEHLLEIINNVLSLSEIQSKKLHESSSIIEAKYILSLAEEIAQKTLLNYNKSLRIISKFIDHPPVNLQIGEKELQIILGHVIDNAVKYTNKGSITISCEISTDKLYKICIKDTGIGINSENSTLIFEYFRQEDQKDSRHYNGIGVGLSICKEILNRVGGLIWVESEKNIGSSFFIAIPIK